jgi:hypothetical protein
VQEIRENPMETKVITFQGHKNKQIELKGQEAVMDDTAPPTL